MTCSTWKPISGRAAGTGHLCLEQCTHLKAVSITDDQPVFSGSSNQTPIRAEAWQRAAKGKALTEVLHAWSKLVGTTKQG